jgi:hypothetical protein
VPFIARNGKPIPGLNTPPLFALSRKEDVMPKDEKTHDHGIVLDEKAQEQPKDRERARTAAKTDKEDELQPLKEKSGF